MTRVNQIAAFAKQENLKSWSFVGTEFKPDPKSKSYPTGLMFAPKTSRPSNVIDQQSVLDKIMTRQQRSLSLAGDFVDQWICPKAKEILANHSAEGVQAQRLYHRALNTASSFLRIQHRIYEDKKYDDTKKGTPLPAISVVWPADVLEFLTKGTVHISKPHTSEYAKSIKLLVSHGIILQGDVVRFVYEDRTLGEESDAFENALDTVNKWYPRFLMANPHIFIANQDVSIKAFANEKKTKYETVSLGQTILADRFRKIGNVMYGPYVELGVSTQTGQNTTSLGRALSRMKDPRARIVSDLISDYTILPKENLIDQVDVVVTHAPAASKTKNKPRSKRQIQAQLAREGIEQNPGPVDLFDCIYLFFKSMQSPFSSWFPYLIVPAIFLFAVWLNTSRTRALTPSDNGASFFHLTENDGARRFFQGVRNYSHYSTKKKTFKVEDVSCRGNPTDFNEFHIRFDRVNSLEEQETPNIQIYRGFKYDPNCAHSCGEPLESAMSPFESAHTAHSSVSITVFNHRQKHGHQGDYDSFDMQIDVFNNSNGTRDITGEDCKWWTTLYHNIDLGIVSDCFMAGEPTPVEVAERVKRVFTKLGQDQLQVPEYASIVYYLGLIKRTPLGNSVGSTVETSTVTQWTKRPLQVSIFLAMVLSLVSTMISLNSMEQMSPFLEFLDPMYTHTRPTMPLLLNESVMFAAYNVNNWTELFSSLSWFESTEMKLSLLASIYSHKVSLVNYSLALAGSVCSQQFNEFALYLSFSEKRCIVNMSRHEQVPPAHIQSPFAWLSGGWLTPCDSRLHAAVHSSKLQYLKQEMLHPPEITFWSHAQLASAAHNLMWSGYLLHTPLLLVHSPILFGISLISTISQITSTRSNIASAVTCPTSSPICQAYSQHMANWSLASYLIHLLLMTTVLLIPSSNIPTNLWNTSATYLVKLQNFTKTEAQENIEPESPPAPPSASTNDTTKKSSSTSSTTSANDSPGPSSQPVISQPKPSSSGSPTMNQSSQEQSMPTQISSKPSTDQSLEDSTPKSSKKNSLSRKSQYEIVLANSPSYLAILRSLPPTLAPSSAIIAMFSPSLFILHSNMFCATSALRMNSVLCESCSQQPTKLSSLSLWLLFGRLSCLELRGQAVQMGYLTSSSCPFCILNSNMELLNSRTESHNGPTKDQIETIEAELNSNSTLSERASKAMTELLQCSFINTLLINLDSNSNPNITDRTSLLRFVELFLAKAVLYLMPSTDPKYASKSPIKEMLNRVISDQFNMSVSFATHVKSFVTSSFSSKATGAVHNYNWSCSAPKHCLTITNTVAAQLSGLLLFASSATPSKSLKACRAAQAMITHYLSPLAGFPGAALDGNNELSLKSFWNSKDEDLRPMISALPKILISMKSLQELMVLLVSKWKPSTVSLLTGSVSSSDSSSDGHTDSDTDSQHTNDSTAITNTLSASSIPSARPSDTETKESSDTPLLKDTKRTKPRHNLSALLYSATEYASRPDISMMYLHKTTILPKSESPFSAPMMSSSSFSSHSSNPAPNAKPLIDIIVQPAENSVDPCITSMESKTSQFPDLAAEQDPQQEKQDCSIILQKMSSTPNYTITPKTHQPTQVNVVKIFRTQKKNQNTNDDENSSQCSNSALSGQGKSQKCSHLNIYSLDATTETGDGEIFTHLQTFHDGKEQILMPLPINQDHMMSFLHKHQRELFANGETSPGPASINLKDPLCHTAFLGTNGLLSANDFQMYHLKHANSVLVHSLVERVLLSHVLYFTKLFMHTFADSSALQSQGRPSGEDLILAKYIVYAMISDLKIVNIAYLLQAKWFNDNLLRCLNEKLLSGVTFTPNFDILNPRNLALLTESKTA